MPALATPLPASRPDNVRGGILLVVGFAVVIPFLLAAVKALGEGGIAATQITAARFALQVAVIGTVLWALNGGRVGRLPRPLWPFVLRGLCITAGSTFAYAGLAVLPMADSSAIFFIEPLLLTALSAVLLGEAVGWRRWSAVAVGFAGALVIIGPNFSGIGWAAALPALAALSFGAAILLTRRFAHLATAPVFQFTTALTACAVLAFALPLGALSGVEALSLSWPDATQAGLLLTVGMIATCTNLMMTQAFRIAPASVLAPFLYLELVGTTLIGFAVFGDLPGWTTVLGAATVVAAGLFVWWRETLRTRR